PSDLISTALFFQTLGAVMSFLLWGRLVDAVGFKSLLGGLVLLRCCEVPLLLLMSPAAAHWQQSQDAASLLGLGALLCWSLISGAVTAGIGIGTTNLHHAYTRSDRAVIEMGWFGSLVMLATAGTSVGAGWFLEHVALPADSIRLAGDALLVDPFKILLMCTGPGASLVAWGILRSLPDLRATPGLGDFFNGLLHQPVATLLRQRHLYHEEEERRHQLARWYGGVRSPLAVEPLLALLDDPSYDVRCEAIRSLGRSATGQAPSALLQHLADPQRRQLWDQYAWALGEIGDPAAADRLQDYLTDREQPQRIRAQCARALGKLSVLAAVPGLASVLHDPETLSHLRSSCCWALLRLDAGEHADAIINALHELAERYDRYELVALLCERLHIDTAWLLRASAQTWIRDMYAAWVHDRSAGWRQQRAAVLDAFVAERAPGLLAHLQAHPDRERPPYAPYLRALATLLLPGREGRLAITLVTAWLCGPGSGAGVQERAATTRSIA
ncbi:MAG: HEAT repeat domain-containing protein, partial [Planctomycetota bacterium]